MVMIGKLVHGCIESRHVKRTHMVLHGADERPAVPVQILPVFVAVLLHAGEEPGDRFHERVIVHDGIPFVSPKPAFRIAVVFRKDQRFRIRLFHCPAEIFPELMVEFIGVSQVRSHIQTPAVYGIRRRHPFFPHFQYMIVQFPGAFVIQLREGIMGPPPVIGSIVRPPVLVAEIKIGPVGTVRSHISARRVSFLALVDPLSVHPFIKGSAVIEYSVQNDPHTSSVDLLHQFCEETVAFLQISPVCHPADIFSRAGVVLVSRMQKVSAVLHDLPVMGIHIVIILAVIFMIAGRNENRIQIKDFHAQILEIIQFIHNTLKVSAVKLPDAHDRRVFGPVLHTFCLSVNIEIFPGLHIIGRISVSETIHKDLVHHRALGPFRSMISGIYLKFLSFTDIHADAVTVVIAGHPAIMDLKIVPEDFIRHGDPCSVIIKPLLGLIDFHSVSFFTGDQKNRIHIIPLCTETDLNLLSRIRFCGSPVIFRAVAEHGVLVENRAHVQDILHFFRDIFFFTLHKQ